MEILKSEQYISEKLNIKPVSKDRLAELCKEPEVDDETRQFIEDHLVWNPSTRCYDCDGDVTVSQDIVSNGRLKIRFGHVKGYFDCSYNELTTLEGSPQEVGSFFGCVDNKLTTLEGAPQKVGGYFDCRYNKLTTLKGAPQEIGGGFNCNGNKLTTLECAPQKVGVNFDCSDNELTTLDGAPQEVGGNFYCSGNSNLVLPKTKPSWIKGRIIQ